MKRYFIYFKQTELEDNGIKELVYSLLGHNDVIEYDDANIYVFNNYDDLMFEDTIKAYMYDLNIKFKCFISRDIKEDNIVSHYNMIYNILKNINKEELYYENSLFDEIIGYKLDIDRNIILKEYANDLEMIYIIKTFINNDLNILQTSKDLYMHRNTLLNKLDKFYNITGYDLRKFKDAYVIYTLIK